MRVILGVMNFGQDRTADARVTNIAHFNEALDLFQHAGMVSSIRLAVTPEASRRTSRDKRDGGKEA